MAINHNIEWEVTNSGVSKSGAAFNNYNANVGLNYAYGTNYQIVTVNDLSLNYADNFKPGIPSWTTSFGGLFPGGTYYIGIRYVALGGENEIVATSEIIEYADFISSNRVVTINSPADPGYPFQHYQVFIRTLAGSFTYAQLQNYGGGEVASTIGTNLSLNTFSTAYESIPVSSLPYKGNIYQISSLTRNFVANDIGNFIYIENNNIGFRSRSASEVDNLNFVEICKTNNYYYAAWFDLNESQTIEQLSAVLWAQGSPSGDLFLELRSDNSGAPSNTVLDSGGINASSLSSSPQWVDIAVNSNLAPGRYWVVIRFDSAPDLSNYVKLGRKSSTGFQNLNNQHLFQYNPSTFTWTSINDGIAVAIGVLWNTTEIWGEGDYSPFLLNEGSLRFEILNVSSGEALICSDYFISNIGNTSGKAYLGGASNNLFQVNEHATEYQINSIAHLESGTYTLFAPLTLDYLSLSGYETEHYDLGNKAVFIVDDGVSPSLYNYSTGSGALNVIGNKIQILNIEINGNDFAEKLLTATDTNIFISNCWLHNSAHSGIVLGTGSSQAIWIETTQISDFNTSSSISSGIYADAANHLILSNCYFNNLAGTAIFANSLSLKADFCIFHNIYGSFTNNGHAIIADSCTDVTLNFLTVNATTKSGVHLRQSSNAVIYNSLFTNGGDHGILIDMDMPLSFKLNRIYNNAFYNNAGNQVEVNPLFLSAISSISLLGNPYVHVGLDYVDFTPDTVSGYGIPLVGTAFPSSLAGTNSLQKLDIGAVQTYGNQPSPRRNPIISLF